MYNWYVRGFADTGKLNVLTARHWTESFFLVKRDMKIPLPEVLFENCCDYGEKKRNRPKHVIYNYSFFVLLYLVLFP